MPRLDIIKKHELTDGVNMIINAGENVASYYLFTSALETLTANWAVVFNGVPTDTMTISIRYKSLVNLNGNNITVIGEVMPSHLADKEHRIECYYDGAAWDVKFVPDFSENGIVTSDTIREKAVTLTKMADLAAGNIISGGTGADLNRPMATPIALANIPVGNAGGGVTGVPLSGDVTMTSAGAVTVAAAAISNAKMAALARGSIKVGGVGNLVTDLSAKTDKNILIGDGMDLTSVPVSGDIAITNLGVTTIQPGVVDTVKIDATGVADVSYLSSDGAVASWVGVPVYRTTARILHANILTLNSIPVDVIASPGVGKGVNVVAWSIRFYCPVNPGTAYATNTKLLIGAETATKSMGEQEYVLQSTIHRCVKGIILDDVITDATQTHIVPNKPIQVSVAVGDPTNGAVGQWIDIDIVYEIIDLS